MVVATDFLLKEGSIPSSPAFKENEMAKHKKKQKGNWRSAIDEPGWRFVCESCAKIIFVCASQMLLRIAEGSGDPACHDCGRRMTKVGTKAKGKKMPR